MHDIRDLEQRAQQLAVTADAELWDVVMETSSVLNELLPARRRPWIASVVNELYDLQEGRCALCDGNLRAGDIDVDHKIPFCYGGGNERGNLQLAHASCNRRKRATVNARDLLRYLEDRYMNR